MKKLVLSLLGAATLATASNAMAMPTNDTYGVFIGTGVGPVFAGVAFFDFDSEAINLGGAVTPGGGSVFPGSCVCLAAQWLNEQRSTASGRSAPPPAAGAFVVPGAGSQEQMSHGFGSCMENAVTVVPSIVTMAPAAYGPSVGFDQFGQISTIAGSAARRGGLPEADALRRHPVRRSAYGPNLSIFSITFQG